MIKRVYLLIAIICTIAIARAQNQPIFTVNGSNIYASEFKRQYPYFSSPYDTTGLYSHLQEYADFRAMEAEAKNLRLDTTAQYRNAMDYHRKRLLTKHIAESKKSQDALKLIMGHSQYQYCVSYIRVDIYGNSHGDTAAAYHKAQRAIDRINNGTDFETVAHQLSDAPDSKVNGGYLGWVSPIAFKCGGEVAEYIISHYGETGKLSRPIRSGDSYYVVRLGGRRNAISEVEIAPIIIRKRQTKKFNDSIAGLFKTIHQRLESGNDFVAIQNEYSESPFSEHLSVDEAYSKYSTHVLDVDALGKHSGIIETDNYFLIARIVDKKALEVNDAYMDYVRDRIPGTETFKQSYAAFLDSIKGISQYRIVGNLNVINRLMPDSTIFEAKWNPGDLRHYGQVLLQFGGKDYTYSDFATYIYKTQYPTGYSKIQEYVSMRFREYLEMLTSAEAYRYLETNDAEYGNYLRQAATSTLCELLHGTRYFPKNTADTAEVISYYRQSFRKMQTSHTLYVRLYDYKNGSNKKRIAKTVDEYSAGLNSAIDTTYMTLVLSDTLHMGQDDKADMIISGFDSGKYNEGTHAIYLDNINHVALVQIVKKPEELSKSEIFSVLSHQYLQEQRKAYMERLRGKYSVRMMPDAYESLVR